MIVKSRKGSMETLYAIWSVLLGLGFLWAIVAIWMVKHAEHNS